MNFRTYSSQKKTAALWLETLPGGWSELRGKQIFDQIRAPKKAGDEQLSATQKYGVVPQSLFMEQEGSRVVLALSGTENFRHVDKGDFVISLRSFQGGIERCYFDGCVSPAYTILKKSRDIAEDFFSYLLKCDWFIAALQIGITGIREGKNISYNEFGKIVLPFPDPEEQAAIAQFLDRETAQIDGLIEKKGRFIELLKEKRAAVITHAVTKGIDADVPMKDSAVEWIGQIPMHWDVIRIAALFREAFRVPDPNLPVLSVSIHDGVTDGELSDEERDRKVVLSEDRTKYQGVAPGDLVYNMMRAWQGAFGAVAVNGLVSPAYVVACPISQFRTKFIEHLLHTRSAAEEIRRFSRGIADFRMRLYWDHFRNLRVCMPPLDEQDAILSYIDRETVRIEGLISKTNRSIELLKEKRSALITAAVTGKIDVRNAA
ncbi:restriction endonuclease subunit S [Rhizobium sp. SIMBA_035]